MAFELKSKFTSNGLIKSVKTGATPLLQNECLQYGKDPNTGERICVTDKSAGKPGTVSGPRGTIDETFANITPEQIAKVVAEGFTGDLSGYKQYVEGYNKGTLPSQRKNYGGEVTVTDPTTGTSKPMYTYEGTPRNIDPKWGKHYGFNEFTNEKPTWREQKDKLRGSKRYRSFSDEKKKKVMDAYKKSFLIMNPGTNFVNRPSSTTRTLSTDTAGKDGSRDYSGLTELEN